MGAVLVKVIAVNAALLQIVKQGGQTRAARIPGI